MQRPTLNPTIFDDPDRHPDPPAGRTFPSLGLVLRGLGRLLVGFLDCIRRLALIPIWPGRSRPAEPAENRSDRWFYLLSRLMIWLTVGGLAVLSAVGVEVYLISRPWSVPRIDPPAVSGLHVSSVHMVTQDNVGMNGFLVPVFDEKRLIRNGQTALTTRWPAVVLVSDPLGDSSRLDALIPWLHDAGYVVLVSHVRDGRTSGTSRTFGLHERWDIVASVNKLRELNYVDTSRVSVIATGSAANAAVLARQAYPGIHRLVIYQPIKSFDQILNQYHIPAHLKPACRWAFEVFYRVDVQDLELPDQDLCSDPNVLVLKDHPARLVQKHRILSFLSRAENTDRSLGVRVGLQD